MAGLTRRERSGAKAQTARWNSLVPHGCVRISPPPHHSVLAVWLVWCRHRLTHGVWWCGAPQVRTIPTSARFFVPRAPSTWRRCAFCNVLVLDEQRQACHSAGAFHATRPTERDQAPKVCDPVTATLRRRGGCKGQTVPCEIGPAVHDRGEAQG